MLPQNNPFETVDEKFLLLVFATIHSVKMAEAIANCSALMLLADSRVRLVCAVTT